MDEQIVFKGQPVNYRKQGNGPWIILLHGFLETIDVWVELANELSDKFSVLMVDLPGHGHSGVMGEQHTMPLLADAVMSVMNHLEINSFVLCGHSLGGYVCMEIAKVLPDQTKGVIMFHSHAAPDDERTKENRTRTINIIKLNHANFIYEFLPDLLSPKNKERLIHQIDRLRNSIASISVSALIATLIGMRERKGTLDTLIDAGFPFFFILGKDDTKMAYNKVVAQAMLAHHAEIMLLSDVGHMGFLEAPKVIFPAIKHFCERNLIEKQRIGGFGD